MSTTAITTGPEFAEVWGINIEAAEAPMRRASWRRLAAAGLTRPRGVVG
jgi:hypothetical protein